LNDKKIEQKRKKNNFGEGGDIRVTRMEKRRFKRHTLFRELPAIVSEKPKWRLGGFKNKAVKGYKLRHLNVLQKS